MCDFFEVSHYVGFNNKQITRNLPVLYGKNINNYY